MKQNWEKSGQKRHSPRVSVQGVKSLGGHFACLCRGFDFYEVKKNVIIFKKEKGNTSTLGKSGMPYIHIFHFGIDFRSCVILVNNLAVNIFL